jgi:hypothetical protein
MTDILVTVGTMLGLFILYGVRYGFSDLYARIAKVEDTLARQKNLGLLCCPYCHSLRVSPQGHSFPVMQSAPHSRVDTKCNDCGNSWYFVLLIEEVE